MYGAQPTATHTMIAHGDSRTRKNATPTPLFAWGIHSAACLWMYVFIFSPSTGLAQHEAALPEAPQAQVSIAGYVVDQGGYPIRDARVAAGGGAGETTTDV